MKKELSAKSPSRKSTKLLYQNFIAEPKETEELSKFETVLMYLGVMLCSSLFAVGLMYLILLGFAR